MPGEIVVTAERRTSSVQKIAIPITAISGAALTASGKTSLDQALRDVPSLQIQSSQPGANVVIRGIGGNEVGGISQDPAVSLSVDGIYSGRTGSTVANLFDVQRIEVLRGPQGTLYGRNASGGAVNILTNDPTHKLGVGLNVGLGNLNYRHVDGYVNVPLDDRLALRVAFDRERRDGYYSNGGGEIDNAGVRVKAKWTPTDRLSILGRFEYSAQKGLTLTSAPLKNAPDIFAPANPGDPWDTEVVDGSPFAVAPVQTNNKYYTTSLQVDWDLGFGALTLIPAWTHNAESISTASVFAPSDPPFATTSIVGNQYTGEARLASPASSAFKWVIGFYGLTGKQTGVPQPPASSTYALLGDSARPASSAAAFAQGTYPVTDRFRATLGARYTVDKKSFHYGVCSSDNGVACNGAYTSPIANLRSKFRSLTYKAGIEYDVAPRAMAYAQVSTGYKAGGFSALATPPTTYKPEKLTNYELGLKSRWLDNKLEINADIYLYQYHDQQIELNTNFQFGARPPIPIQYIPAADLSKTYMQVLDINAGNSRYKGAEIQSVYRPTPNDKLSLQLAYQDTAYGNLVLDTTGGPPGTEYASPYYDMTGRHEAHAPTWSGAVGYQHTFHLASGSLVFDTNTRFQSSNIVTIQRWFADGQTRQKGYHQTDLFLTYNHEVGNWSLNAWVKNLENNAIRNYVFPLYKATLDPPRTYGVTASVQF